MRNRFAPLAVRLAMLSCLLLTTCLATSCTTRIAPPDRPPDQIVTLTVTAYCNCQKCCGWHYSWFGLGPAVVSNGPNKGKRKIVGQTALGTQARHGTLAADTTVYPFGTIMQIPGFGCGIVEDRGGAIKGGKLDLWMSSHEEAKQWGVQKLKVKVWRSQ